MLKVYVINLESRPDRRAHMEEQLSRLGVTYELVPAVDAQVSTAVRDLKDRGVSQSGYVISDGAVACGLSHRSVWEKHLQSGEKYCVVLEDDLLFADSFPKFLDEDWIPADADIVKLETLRVRTHLGRHSEGMVANSAVRRLLGRHACTGAYLISKDAAASLLSRMSPNDAVDEVIFNEAYGWMPKAALYQVSPAPTIQLDRLDPNDGKAKSSIGVRSRDGDAAARVTLSDRVLRRVQNEIRALIRGSAYSVVPFAK